VALLHRFANIGDPRSSAFWGAVIWATPISKIAGQTLRSIAPTRTRQQRSAQTHRSSPATISAALDDGRAEPAPCAPGPGCKCC
jgi:hypothetical protein